jgi:DNA-binding Lrp family transcriptional regulator
VGIFIEKSKKAEVLTGLCKIDGVKEVYEVAGEFDILSIVSVSSMAEFRETLQRQIMRVKGVSSVVTSIVLAPHEHSKKLVEPVS